MPEPASRPDQPGEPDPKARPRSPFLGVVGGAGEAAGDAVGSALDAASGLASGLAGALEGAVREAIGPQRPARDTDGEAQDAPSEPRERS